MTKGFIVQVGNFGGRSPETPPRTKFPSGGEDGTFGSRVRLWSDEKAGRIPGLPDHHDKETSSC
jgi:hypothetical protein